jgi:integrase
MKEREANKYPCDIYWHQWKALEPHFGHRTPGTMTAQDWRAYADKRINELGRSPSTVHTELVRLRAALAWAVKADLIPKAPLDYIPTPSKPRERVLSRDEVRRLLEAAEKHSDPHIHLFIVLAFNTGARHRAILDLTWDRVDFASGIIDYDDDLPKDPLAKSWRKGRATVLMSKAARQALQTAWSGRQTSHVVEHGGRRLTTVREGFKNAVERAGLGWHVDGEFRTDVTPHTIRHTFITRMQTRRVHTKLTAMFVGHGDEDTTNKVYTHLDVEALRDVVAAVDDEFSLQPALPQNGEILPPEDASEAEFQAILSRLGRRLENSGFGEDGENA